MNSVDGEHCPFELRVAELLFPLDRALDRGYITSEQRA